MSNYKTLQICIQDYIHKIEKNTVLRGNIITTLEGIPVAQFIKHDNNKNGKFLNSYYLCKDETMNDQLLCGLKQNLICVIYNLFTILIGHSDACWSGQNGRIYSVALSATTWWLRAAQVYMKPQVSKRQQAAWVIR